MKATCSVDGCVDRAASRGWCQAHYTRWRRTGDVGAARIARKGDYYECAADGCDRRGHSKGYCYAHYSRFVRRGDAGSAAIWNKQSPAVPCMLDECEETARSLGLCNKHYLRWYRHQDLQRDHRGSNHPRWLAREDLSYDAAHDRVKRYRGRASEHACTCGAQAHDWAYDHSEDDPLVDEKRRPYSDDWMRYVAMCRGCHKVMDVARLGGRYCNDDAVAAERVRIVALIDSLLETGGTLAELRTVLKQEREVAS